MDDHLTDREPMQAGMTNNELRAAWHAKLPGAEPTERQLSAFAVGAEVGWARARTMDRQNWSRMHHAIADAGLHPGRTDDMLWDVVRDGVAALRAQVAALLAERDERIARLTEALAALERTAGQPAAYDDPVRVNARAALEDTHDR